MYIETAYFNFKYMLENNSWIRKTKISVGWKKLLLNINTEIL